MCPSLGQREISESQENSVKMKTKHKLYTRISNDVSDGVSFFRLEREISENQENLLQIKKYVAVLTYFQRGFEQCVFLKVRENMSRNRFVVMFSWLCDVSVRHE